MKNLDVLLSHNHDLTKKEREECKQLVEEAKAKTSADASGEWRSPRKDGDCENEETEQLKFSNSNKLLVIYANVDSLSNKLEELKFRISSMHPKPHLIALTEIKHKNKWNIDISELQIDGYIIYCNNLQENGRGIVNYERSDLVCKQYIPETPFTESLHYSNFRIVLK